MTITFSEFTSAGLVRENNQDNILSAAKDNFGLFAVADGMGGHFGGEIASGRLIDALKKWWIAFIADPSEFDVCITEIKSAITDVNRSIYNEFSKDGKICGTTLALVLIYEDKYLLINIGDSRIYSLRKKVFSQESVDHVFSKEAKLSGKFTDEEINVNKNKNKLTSAVGCKEKFKMNVKTSSLNASSFFICTDGIYKFCGKHDIKRFIKCADPNKLKKNVQTIIERNSTNDNYSYIKVDCSNRKHFGDIKF